MNVTTRREFQVSEQTSDEKMEQIRELLFGETQRQTEAHISLLEDRVRELELSVHRRIDALQARIDALAAEVDAGQRSALEELAKGMHDLGERVRRIPKP